MAVKAVCKICLSFRSEISKMFFFFSFLYSSRRERKTIRSQYHMSGIPSREDFTQPHAASSNGLAGIFHSRDTEHTSREPTAPGSAQFIFTTLETHLSNSLACTFINSALYSQGGDFSTSHEHHINARHGVFSHTESCPEATKHKAY